MLLNKTSSQKGNIDLPKLYYCAGSSEYMRFFDEISKDIFTHCDCSMWYKSDPTEATDETSLEEMQLAVVPITKTLLTENDAVFEKEYAFISSKHIPVLPILLEDDIEQHYERKFGCIQYLNRVSTDFTEISYSEKLRKYLNSVLISDTLIEKVKAAFDAYIFISYRKKDRVHAKKLMRLIHENEMCQSFATWYDEFLVPGENYNTHIQSSLEKSDAFALVVTPNLLDDDNYVAKCEYPAALQLNKPIIPFEAERTDKNSLSEKYSMLPDCISESETELFYNILIKQLGKLASIQRDNDTPEHTFFIGLAYMNGIDVETDKKAGAKLIRAAALQNLPEAIEKLVDIYKTGDGAEYSISEAIIWQEKLADLYKEAYNNDTSEENAFRYTDSLYELAELYELADDQRNGIRTCRNITALLTERSDNKFSDALVKRILSAYVKEGFLESKRCASPKALSCAQSALDFIDKNAERIDEKSLAYELYQLNIFAGDALMYDADLDVVYPIDHPDLKIGSATLKKRFKANKHYAEANRILSSYLTNESSISPFYFELVSISMKTCSFMYKIGDFDEAENLCKRAKTTIELIDVLFHAQKTTALFAEVCENYGAAYIFNGKYNEAKENFLLAAEKRHLFASNIKEISEHTFNADTLSEEYVNIFLINYSIGAIDILNGEPKLAKEQFELALDAFNSVESKDCVEAHRLRNLVEEIKDHCRGLNGDSYYSIAAGMLSDMIGNNETQPNYYCTDRLRKIDARFFEISHLTIFLLAVKAFGEDSSRELYSLAEKSYRYLESQEMISPLVLNEILRLRREIKGCEYKEEPVTSVMDHILNGANAIIENTKFI